MKIVNETDGATISQQTQIRTSFFGRLRGLILSKKRDIVLKAKKESIKASSIHMFGMLYPIDVIWLDSKKRVVDFKKNVNPFSPLKPKSWKIYRPRGPARYVVELGLDKIKNIEIGDAISFE